jgi:peptide/nickel transport system ATP-binding protein
MPPQKLKGSHSVRCLRGGIVDIVTLGSVAKDYGPVKALRPTSLRIQSGEVFCLVGETGSGKTTLANIAAGLLKQDQGSRTFDGRDMDTWISDDYSSLAKQIGVVYQNPVESVSHRLSLFEIVAEPLRIQRTVRGEEEIRRAVYRAIADVRLSADPVFLRRYPHELNMGALQRIAIARALVTDPVFIVADEPTSALDPSIQAKVLKLLLDLQTQKGLTMLFVTHNIGLARKIADHVGVMLAGYLVETGPAIRVLSHPAHPYTRMLLESARYSTGSEVNAPGRDQLKGCPFGSRCEEVREVCIEFFPGQMVGLNHNNHRTLCPFSKGTVRDEKKQILC